MNRKECERYIAETYKAEAETPWVKYPNYIVFRHSNNQKWFALLLKDVYKRQASGRCPLIRCAK